MPKYMPIFLTEDGGWMAKPHTITEDREEADDSAFTLSFRYPGRPIFIEINFNDGEHWLEPHCYVSGIPESIREQPWERLVRLYEATRKSDEQDNPR